MFSLWFYKHNVDNLILIVYKRQNWFQRYCIYLVEMSSSFFFNKFFCQLLQFWECVKSQSLHVYRKQIFFFFFLGLVVEVWFYNNISFPPVSVSLWVWNFQCNSFPFVHLSCLVLMILCGTTHLLFKCGNSSITCMGQVDWRW